VAPRRLQGGRCDRPLGEGTRASAELRTWFGHDPARFAEFERRYIAELHSNPAALAELRALARKGTVTLVYAARDEAHNDAVVLRKVLLR